jgi:hypothetical protein
MKGVLRCLLQIFSGGCSKVRGLLLLTYSISNLFLFKFSVIKRATLEEQGRLENGSAAGRPGLKSALGGRLQFAAELPAQNKVLPFVKVNPARVLPFKYIK